MTTKQPDVIVVGAGIIGAACAYRLATAGLRVTVLERDAPAAHASQAALGTLTFHAKPDAPPAFNQLSMASQPYFPAVVDELAAATGERVEFQQRGQLLVAPLESDRPWLARAREQNKALGVEFETPDRDELRMLEPRRDGQFADGLFFPHDAWVDNTALTLAYAEAARLHGARFEIAHVGRLESDTATVTVHCAAGVHSAGWAVLAAGCWSGQIGGLPALPVHPVRGQALAVARRLVERVIMSPRGYLVPKGAGQTMLGATEEHDAGFEAVVTPDGLAEVARAGAEIAPVVGRAEFMGAWAGLRPGTPDALPIIGPFEAMPRVIAATGHFRNGILFAPITAHLVASAIAGDEPPLDPAPYAPARFN